MKCTPILGLGDMRGGGLPEAAALAALQVIGDPQLNIEIKLQTLKKENE
jgi:hypothetical protein